MQSSSQLFPVRLVSAELIGTLVEDIYLLKPNNSSDHSVELAVTRLSKKNTDHNGPPVILLHGSFSNRRRWLSADGKGVAAYLVDAGFDVWLPEMRGHGLSPVNKAFDKNSVDQVVKNDLPAIQQFVMEQTGKKINWIAEESGGLFVLASLALGSIDQKTVAGLTCMEESDPLAQKLDTKIYSKTALWRWKKRGVISGRRIGVGLENESYVLVREYLRWQNSEDYNTPAGLMLEQAYSEINVPMFVVGSNADAESPFSKKSLSIYQQIASNTKIFKTYDYRMSQRQLLYNDGVVTLFPSESGCWKDVTHWLNGHYGCLGNTESEIEYLAIG